MKYILKDLFDDSFVRETKKYIENKLYIKLENDNIILLEPISSHMCIDFVEFDKLSLKVLNSRGLIYSEEIAFDNIFANFKRNGVKKIIVRKDNYETSEIKFQWDTDLTIDDKETLISLVRDFVSLWNVNFI